MEVLSLSSSLNISKPLHFLPLSSKQHQRPPRMQLGVSCGSDTKVEVAVADETNLYKILRLSPKSATLDDIKRAYRSMALRYHPDVCRDRDGFEKEESTRKFVQLNAAYRTLSNPRLRAEYDSELGLIGSDDNKSWKEQLVELKRTSHIRMAQNEGSWASRVRAQNMKNKDHN